jgi:hypothetical protein
LTLATHLIDWLLSAHGDAADFGDSGQVAAAGAYG